MTEALLRGDARMMPLADECVDLIVTSPPYFGLRSYTDGGEHYQGQIGLETTPAQFLDALIGVTAEMIRVLKPSGSIWVNLGDKYCASGRGPDGSSSGLSNGAQFRVGNGIRPADCGVRRKSLIGLPWRYAIRCIDELGLILREEIIWDKPNGLPESVTDRCRRSHEQWFHFTREPHYYSAVDEIRDPHVHRDTPRQLGAGRNASPRHQAATDNLGWKDRPVAQSPLGKLPGSVWTVATQPLSVPSELGVDHYAAFPMEWPRRIITGWSPARICVACGEGRRPSIDQSYEPAGGLSGKRGRLDSSEPVSNGRGINAPGQQKLRSRVTVIGEICSCRAPIAPTRPAVVLDPFGGTGTTAMVAQALGRHGISLDMSGDYCRLARWRTTDPGQRAAAMQVVKPAAAVQESTLFDLADRAVGRSS